MILKALFLCILPTIVIMLTIPYCAKHLIFFDLVTLNAYINECSTEISSIFVQEESKELYGKLLLNTDYGEFLLETTFYFEYILNKDFIQEFLKELPWQKIIQENQFDIVKIKQIIVKEYHIHIHNIEKIYNNYLLQDAKILDAKQNIRDVLGSYFNTFYIPEDIKPMINIIEIKDEVIMSIDFLNYMKTKDFQSGEFFTMKYILKKKMELFDYHQIYVMKENKHNISTEKKLFDIITLISVHTTFFIRVIPGIVNHLRFLNFTSAIIQKMGMEIIPRCIRVTFNMSDNEKRELFLWLASKAIVKHGFFTVSWALMRAYWKNK